MTVEPQAQPRRIALWFRYGPAEHTELFHAIPEIVEALAQHAEVHYFGFESGKEVPKKIQQHAIIHTLPFSVDRTRSRDKLLKTLLWIVLLPFVANRCRQLHIDAVFMDEPIPLTAWIARTFFGHSVALSVADFFPEIYFGSNRLLAPLVRLFRRWETGVWKKLPVLFTRAKSTKEHLVQQGFQADRIHPVYDPCDFTLYHPEDRLDCRKDFGLAADDRVLVHHGILHPNKGNDWIIRQLHALQPEFPSLRYLLIGDGSEMEKLKQLVRENGMENTVLFTGWLPRLEQVNRALNCGDIGLVMRVGMPEDDFHMTGALIHSMACALPILTARLAGVCEVIHEDDAGLIFSPDEPEEFQAKLRRLLEDAPLRRRLGDRALALAEEHFELHTVARKTVDPLVRLLENAS